MSGAATIEVRVARKTAAAQDICSFELVAADGGALPAFAAGAHIDLHLPGAGDGADLVRQYSLCNDPRETHRYLLGVLREPASRGGSQALHERVREGDRLRISAPKNHFVLAREARRSLLLAGGIGITPLLSMAECLAGAGGDFELHYCARAPARAAFRQRIDGSGFADRVRYHFDDGAPEQRLELTQLLRDPQDGVHLYVCGPRGFIDAVLEAARAQGWPQSRLHHEFFGAELAPAGADTGFEVALAGSGQVIAVAPGQSVVQALAAAGVAVMTACEQGVCGTCLTRVLEGVPEHRDSYLTPEERAANDQFLPCCSRSKTPRLLLDL